MRLYGKWSLRLAARHYGWLLALATALLALFIAWAGINPVNEVEDHVAAPVARSLNIIEGRCPDGWSHFQIEEHIVQETCSKASIVAVLYPYMKKANYGLETRNPDALPTPCRLIPGWPDSWCVE